MSLRRRCSLLAGVLALASCLLMFGSTAPNPPTSPGQVTFQHSAIEDHCSSCHVAADGNASSLFEFAFSMETALSDSQKCLECHDDLGPSPLSAHSQVPKLLASHQPRVAQNTSRSKTSLEGKASAPNRPLLLAAANAVHRQKSHAELACATCHVEHRGKSHDLTRMTTDLQCQSCHSTQFNSFADGHPELGVYGYSRRTRLYFDHTTHLQQYFVDGEYRRLAPGGDHPHACVGCHQPDPTGSVMHTRGFNQMCASCHESRIEDREFPGVAFLSIPNIDTSDESVRDAIGQWPPRNERPAFRIAPFMSMLLASDREFREASESLGVLVADDLSQKLQPVSDKEIRKAAATYAWAIKELLGDVNRRGRLAIDDRLKDRYPGLADLEPSIVPSLSYATQFWFPGLAVELQERQQKDGAKPGPANSKKKLQTGPDSPFETPLESQLGGGWYIRQEDHTVRYRPQGHSDPLLKRLLDATVRALNDSTRKDSDLRRLLDSIANPSASGTLMTGPVSAGQCLLCHTVDKEPSGKLRINWYAKRAGDTESRLTAFSHTPHMQLPTETGCVSCHQLDRERSSDSYRSEFFRRDAESAWKPVTDSHQPLASGFVGLSKSHCANCHTASSAGDSCLKCHNYHAHTATGRVTQFWRDASSLKWINGQNSSPHD